MLATKRHKNAQKGNGGGEGLNHEIHQIHEKEAGLLAQKGARSHKKEREGLAHERDTW
jgi:hypothetical protein